MKTTAITGFIASILMATGVALAADNPTVLTTKNYVDSGLIAVYGTASAAEDQAATNAGDISGLSSTVESHGTAIGTLSEIVGSVAEENGLAYDVDQLKSQVTGLGGSEITSAEDGIAISDHKIKLALPAETTAGKPYVYKAGTGWTELGVQNTWTPNAL